MSPFLAALVATVLSADPEPRPGDKMMDAFLDRLTRERSAVVFDGATTQEEWTAKLPRLRREYLDMLGLWPLPKKTPLEATVTGMVSHAGVVIEKLHFQSLPGLYVTGNLYRPKEPKGKLPAILYVCGHSGRGRDGNKTAFQDHGLWFASNGYVCLVIDTLQLGEVAGKHHGTYNLGRFWWQAAGYTPAGVECWNGIRAIDYLVSRPEVDADRVGVTGISGGGAATFWISAADERVKVAVPVSGMSDLESYVSHKVINGHCDCMFLVNTYGWEWTTIAALIAPRPLLFANSDNDGIFPMDGNRRIIDRLRKLYKMLGKPDLVEEHVSPGGHDYRPDLRVAIFKFFNKHLKNDTAEVKDAAFMALPGKDLRVFPEDRDLPANALNGKIDESFVPRAEVKLPAEGKYDEWKADLTKLLREKSFRSFPERVPAGKLAAPAEATPLCSTLTTEPGIECLVVTTGGGEAGSRSGILLVLGPEDLGPGKLDLAALKQGKDVPQWFLPLLDGGINYALLPRGVAEPWTTKSPPNYVERAHALLGRTVDEGRVWDVIAAVRKLDAETGGKRQWKVVGRGQAGVLAAYAAIFEPTITEVVLVDPPASHREGPIFLNVLRVLDVPEALGLLAPRKLTLIGAKDAGFARTATIYQRAGAADRFKR
jgi:cephalosporin-C deacetylase-like acetyl esterase